MFAPGGDDATVIFPTGACVAGNAGETGVAVVTDSTVVVPPGNGVVFVDSITVALVTGMVVFSEGTCVVTGNSTPVPLVAGMIVEFVLFISLAETGNNINATISRIMISMRIFFMIVTSFH
jgi:hypothetical protein